MCTCMLQKSLFFSETNYEALIGFDIEAEKYHHACQAHASDRGSQVPQSSFQKQWIYIVAADFHPPNKIVAMIKVKNQNTKVLIRTLYSAE